MERVVNDTHPTVLPPGKDLVHVVQEAGLAPGQVWTGAKNLAPSPLGFDPQTVQPVAICYPVQGIVGKVK